MIETSHLDILWYGPCHAAWQVYEQVLIAALDIDDQQLVTVSWHQLR